MTADHVPAEALDCHSPARLAQRPAFSEPAAAAVGLRRAGWPVEVTAVVEVSDPLDDVLPQRAVVAALNGLAPTTRDEWDAAVGALGEELRVHHRQS